jgi:hypothetical protein
VSPKKSDWRKRWRKNFLVKFFTDLRLTVSLLACSLALVFFGTLDQSNIGINKALKVYFESFYAVWKYPEEWPLGTRMVLVTHPDNPVAKSHEEIAVDDPALEGFRFMGFIDNTFHRQIEAVFEDTEGKLKPDSNLRFHSIKDIKLALSKNEFKNGHGAILPHTALLPPEEKEWEGIGSLPAKPSEKTKEPELASVDLEGQFPFTLHDFPIPLPGGYLLGGLLLVNLLTSAVFRYPLTLRYTGIWTLHGGVALMLVGELVTDLTETHSSMPIIEGESANFSSDFHLDELALINESDPDADHVLSIPAKRLDPMPDDLGSKIGRWFSSEEPALPVINLKEINPDFPFVLRVKEFYKNVGLRKGDGNETSYEMRNSENFVETWAPQRKPEEFTAESRNLRGAVIELAPVESPDEIIDTWLVSSFLNVYGFLPHPFKHDGKSYRMEMRQKRYYHPFDVELLDFRFLRYPGTGKAKDFSSDVNLRIPGEPDRPTRIYMNHPLHLKGLVFFQRSFDPENDRRTILEVVRNPGSLLPYVGVSMVGLGLMFQFGMHLFGFARRQEKKATS